MEIEQMIVGVEVSTKEMEFVRKVVGEIRQSYNGPIEVVGSRKDANRFSTKKVRVYCQDLDDSQPGEYERWKAMLNQIAREHDIPAGSIHGVLEYITEPLPEEVQRLFNSPNPIDADLDLAIDEPRGQIEANYYDQQPPEGSGLVIEIYEPGDFSYISTNIYNF